MGRSVRGIGKWFGEFLIPTLLLFLLADDWSLQHVMDYLLLTLLVYSLYEVGYLWNDTYTIRKEKNPTLRLNHKELAYVLSHKSTIYEIRLLLAVFITLYVLMEHDWSTGSLRAILAAWSILLVYALYNTVRGHLSFVLHLLLLMLRYTSAWLLVSKGSLLSMLMLTLFIFPLPIMMEIVAKGKFGITYRFTSWYLKDYSKRYLFRLKYYSLLCLVYALFSLNYFVLTGYFIMYEIMLYLSLGKHKRP